MFATMYMHASHLQEGGREREREKINWESERHVFFFWESERHKEIKKVKKKMKYIQKSKRSFVSRLKKSASQKKRKARALRA